jgi:hypothetical protein
MFSFFKKSPKKPAYEDKVWTEARYKWEALGRDVASAAQAGQKVVVAAHFAQTVDELHRLVVGLGLEFGLLTDDRPGIPPPAQVYVVQASRLAGAGAAMFQRALGPAQVAVMVAEHFPLPQADLDLLLALAELAPQAKPAFYTALDDSFLSRFVGDGLTPMLERLGLEPGECFNHSMIAKSIANAQQKIAASVPDPRPARSAQEWMLFNSPG